VFACADFNDLFCLQERFVTHIAAVASCEICELFLEGDLDDFKSLVQITRHNVWWQENTSGRQEDKTINCRSSPQMATLMQRSICIKTRAPCVCFYSIARTVSEAAAR
jgi:hypothetical protein